MERDVRECAERFLEGSAEREYHEAVLGVLAGAEFPEEEDVGLALIEVLQTAEFRIDGVDSTRHLAAGSLVEDADLVACVFREVSDDPTWWAATFQHLTWQGRNRIAEWVDFWEETFRAAPGVDHFER